MKVLYVTGIFSTKYGGFEKYIIQLLRCGIELSVVFNNNPQPDSFYEDLSKLNAQIFVVKGNIFQRSFQVFKIIKSIKPNIVHYHFGFYVYLLSLLVKVFFPNIRQVYTQHCEYLSDNILMKYLTKYCYRLMDLVIAVSEGVKAGLINKIGNLNNLIVCYLGVDKGTINNFDIKNQLDISQKSIVITSIGFDINVKGFDILAKAVSLLKKNESLPDFKVIIIGLNDDENNKFKSLIKGLNIEDKFISVGIRNDVDDFLSISDIYVQSSRTEAISLSIMEAMLYGNVIIGAAVGGIPEVCINEYNGLLFEKENVVQLNSILEKLLLNKTLRSIYSSNSIKLSYKFNRMNSVQNLISEYNNLLRK